ELGLDAGQIDRPFGARDQLGADRVEAVGERVVEQAVAHRRGVADVEDVERVARVGGGLGRERAQVRDPRREQRARGLAAQALAGEAVALDERGGEDGAIAVEAVAGEGAGLAHQLRGGEVVHREIDAELAPDGAGGVVAALADVAIDERELERGQSAGGARGVEAGARAREAVAAGRRGRARGGAGGGAAAGGPPRGRGQGRGAGGGGSCSSCAGPGTARAASKGRAARVRASPSRRDSSAAIARSRSAATAARWAAAGSANSSSSRTSRSATATSPPAARATAAAS